MFSITLTEINWYGESWACKKGTVMDAWSKNNNAIYFD